MTERSDGSVQVEVRGNLIYVVISDGERSGTIYFTLSGATLLADCLERAVKQVERAAMGQQG